MGLFDGGITRGLQSGISYMVQWGKLLIWSVEHNKTDATADCIAILKQWIAEVTDEAGTVTTHIVSSIIGALIVGGHDPFAGSRHLLQQALIKYKH